LSASDFTDCLSWKDTISVSGQYRRPLIILGFGNPTFSLFSQRWSVMSVTLKISRTCFAGSNLIGVVILEHLFEFAP
jgi:hypothetical protein